MSMFRKLWFWIAIGLVAAAVVFAFARSGKKEKENGAALKTAKVTKGNLLASITATGVTRPIQTVELKCKASGEIKFLPIDDGKYVQKGDLICKLDQTTAKNDYEQAKADYDVAIASEKQQKKEFDRILELYQKKLVSESERDASELAFQRTHSTSVRAQAALSTSSERMADTELRAPIDGIILRRDVEVGQVISSGVSSVSGGTTIALLADLDHVNVLADVDETDIGRVKIGQTVKAVADAYPDQEFSGRVLKIAPLAKMAQNVTTFEVTAEVDNPGHLLKSGMNANVEIMTAERRNVLMVPNEAIKELSEVIPYFSDEERKKFEGFAMNPGGGNRQNVSLGGGGGGRSGGGGRPGGGRQFRGNFDLSKIDTTKLDPEARERIRNWQKRQAERKAKGDTIGVVEVPKWVLVKEKDKITPKRVLAGVSNLDNTEIISGLAEGDEVIAQPTSMLAKEREEMQQRMRSFSGIPGMSGGSGGGRR